MYACMHVCMCAWVHRRNRVRVRGERAERGERGERGARGERPTYLLTD